MSDSSRRGFLILAGAGAAAVGAVALAPGALAAGREHDGHGQVGGPLVAYVSDLRAGEVSVMMGEREVVVHDPALCASLARVLT